MAEIPNKDLDQEIILSKSSHLKEIFKRTIKKEILDNEYYEKLILSSKEDKTLSDFKEEDRPAIRAIRISRNALRMLNYFALEDDGTPKRRDQELNEKNEHAFIIEHPIDVAHWAFSILPKDNKNLADKEKDKFEYIDENPHEMVICGFLHDFIEENYKGALDSPHPSTGFTARETIWKYLNNDKQISLDEEVKHRIWNRLVMLTKPPARYPEDSTLSKQEKDELYIPEYKNYLNQIIKSNDPIAQYIKLCDILQNAQSQKKELHRYKRTEKAKLQIEFIKKVFPTFARKLLQEKPELFQNMADTNFVTGMKKEFLTPAT